MKEHLEKQLNQLPFWPLNGILKEKNKALGEQQKVSVVPDAETHYQNNSSLHAKL
jgi:hypothetical protein